MSHLILDCLNVENMDYPQKELNSRGGCHSFYSFKNFEESS